MASPTPVAPQPPSSIFPDASFTTLFADGILNFAHTPEVVKFYLFRIEPSFDGNAAQVVPFSQLVMSMDGFLVAFAHMERGIQNLIKAGAITQERLDQHRKDTKLDFNNG